jgi:hypothetical protein
VLILKEVKVICFDTLLQMLILQGLYCTKIVQNGLFLAAVNSKGILFQGAGVSPKMKSGSEAAALQNPH